MTINPNNHRGISIIEAMVALTILLVAIVGSSNLFIAHLQLNGSSRRDTLLLSEVQDIFELYREMDYRELVQLINADVNLVLDDSYKTIDSKASSVRATFQTTLTASRIKTTGLPESVRISITAQRNKGIFGVSTDTFETIVTGSG